MTWLLSPTERFPIYPYLQYRPQGKEKTGIGNPDPGEARMTRKRRTVRCPLPARAAGPLPGTPVTGIRQGSMPGRPLFRSLPGSTCRPAGQTVLHGSPRSGTGAAAPSAGPACRPATSGPARCPRSMPRRFPSAHACRSHDRSLQSAKICTNCGIWCHHRACSLRNRSTRQVFRL